MQSVMFPRADRVALGIPILYHRPGDDQWFQAKVVNLSESGVLFGPSELEPGTPVEVILSPPIQVGALASGKQVCVAKVVRITESQAVAVRFDECRFLLEEYERRPLSDARPLGAASATSKPTAW
jgi:hypothetical protein